MLFAWFVVLWRALLESALGIFMWLLGKPRIAHLKVTCGDSDLERSLLEQCPSMCSFSPAPWAPGPYSQTLFANLSTSAAPDYERVFVETDDGARVAVDWVHGDDLTEDSTVLLVLPGIAGSSASARSCRLMRTCREYKWRGAVYNRRGHGGLPIEPDTGKSDRCRWYPLHADVEDMDAVVQHIRAQYPKAKVIAIGFSLGSNVLLKYAGEKGSECELHSCISVSNGFDMVEGTRYVQTEPALDAILTSKLKNLLDSNVRSIQQSGSVSPEKMSELRKSSSVRQFDEILIPSLYEYEDIDQYYADCSCKESLTNICIPSLLIVSQDDPVLGPHHHGIAVAAAKANSNIITVTTCTGGHLGWIEASGSWLVKMTVQYIQAIQELSVVSPSSIHLDVLPELQVNYSRHKMSSHRH